MKKENMKRLLAALLAVVMVLGNMNLSTMAAEAKSGTSTAEYNPTATSAANTANVETTEMSVEGTNGFGSLLAKELEEKTDEMEDNQGYNVFSIEMSGKEATVSYEAQEDCTLVVAIYDEDGEQMFASGQKAVLAEEKEAVVTIETDDMPEYYYVRGYLVHTNNLKPLCTAYSTPKYTKDVQDLLKSTTADYDAEKVINFDEDTTNNFAVASDKTKIIPQSDTKNQVASVNEETSTYIIENADDNITSLKPGDMFVYEYGENEMLVVKVASVTMKGTTATITGQDTSLEEVFDYVKMDGTADTEGVEPDTSMMDEGVEYLGHGTQQEEAQAYNNPGIGSITGANEGVELGGSIKDTLGFELKKEKNGITVSGGLDLGLGASVNVYVTLKTQSLELKTDYSAKLTITISASADDIEIPLAKIPLSPVPGVNVNVIPKFVLEAEVSLTVEGTLSGSVGFSVSNKEGFKNLTENPSFDAGIEVEGTLFVGIAIELDLNLITEKLADASITGEIGVEITAENDKKGNEADGKDAIHTCFLCLDGDIKAKVSLSLKASLLNLEALTFKKTFTISCPIGDFYFSLDEGKLGWGECPYRAYRTVITVVDGNGNPIEGAFIKEAMFTNELFTDKDGRAELYLASGKYQFTIKKNEATISKEVTIEQKKSSIKIILGVNGSNDSGKWDDIPADAANYNGHYYYLYTGNIASTYDEAAQYCKSKGGYLATLTSQEENDFVYSYILQQGCDSAYFGLSDAASEGNWVWCTGEPLSYINWHSGEPNSENTNEDYTMFYYKYSDGSWNDGDFGGSTVNGGTAFICEWGDFSKGFFENEETKSTSAPALNSTSASEFAHTFQLPATQQTEAGTSEGTLLKTAPLTETFTALRPKERYNFYVMKARSADAPLSAANLLYIAQGESDKEGKLTISYQPKETPTDAEIFIVGEHDFRIEDAKIEPERMFYTGEEQFVSLNVTYDGALLKEGVDYELSGDYSATEIGDYAVTVEGIGNYTGSREVTYTVKEGSLMKGDVNGDGTVTATDALIVLQYDVKLIEPPADKRAADVNGDGVITATDALLILQHDVNLIDLNKL